MRKQWNTVLVVALILVVVFFAVINVDPVNINFGFTTVEIPLVIVIIGTLLIGLLIAVMWSTTIIFRERSNVKKLSKQLEHSQSQTTEEKAKLVNGFEEERAMLKEQHQKEKEALQSQITTQETEIRELNRHVHNMQTSRTSHKSI